jgi:hypothetical protein
MVSLMGTVHLLLFLGVLDPKVGLCADPVDRVAILGKGGPGPHSRDGGRQLAPDKGSGKT